LLAKAGQTDIRKPLDRFEEIIDTRLHIGIQAEILPEPGQFDIGAWIWVLAVFTLEKLARHIKVALVAHHRTGLEVSGPDALIAEVHPLPVFGEGDVFNVSVRLLVVKVVILKGAFAPPAEMKIKVRPA